MEKLNLFDLVSFTKPVELKQVMWPDHCTQNSWGAELHKDLRVSLLHFTAMVKVGLINI